MKKRNREFWKCLRKTTLLAPLLFLVGCASSYHCYPCGQVNCGYCPRNALPYSSGQTNCCVDSIGQKYLVDHSELARPADSSTQKN